MNENEKKDIQNSEEMSLAEKNLKLKAERRARIEKKIEERNAAAEERNKQLAEKYGFTSSEPTSETPANSDSANNENTEETPSPAQEENTVIDSIFLELCY